MEEDLDSDTLNKMKKMIGHVHYRNYLAYHARQHNRAIKSNRNSPSMAKTASSFLKSLVDNPRWESSYKPLPAIGSPPPPQAHQSPASAERRDEEAWIKQELKKLEAGWNSSTATRKPTTVFSEHTVPTLHLRGMKKR